MYWLAGGAVAMGMGIWAMHFIGMLGFRYPTPLSYDVPITFLSLAIAIAASTFALAWVSSGPLGFSKLLFGGVTMGAGIAAMHYTGMAAMKMEPPIRYDPLLFALSILIAVTAAIAALWCAFKLRMETFSSAFWKSRQRGRHGTAIYGMHYPAWRRRISRPAGVSAAAPQRLEHTWLAITLGALALLFLLATLTMFGFGFVHRSPVPPARARASGARSARPHDRARLGRRHEINSRLRRSPPTPGAGGRWLKGTS